VFIQRSKSSSLFLWFLFEAGIQERTENFQYGHFDSRNRPPPILVKHLQNDRIVATAAQKLCLFRLFPIIFHDVIDRLPSMIVYKQLREIIDLVLSIPFRREWLPVLRDFCVAFQKSMLLHFTDKVVPKVHFVCEYAQITQDYGPLRRQWCFRYEAAHAYFKKLVLRSNNFKNIPKMLATRFAFKQAFRLLRSCTPEDVCYAVSIRRLRSQSLNKQIKQVLSDQLGDDLNQDLIECKRLFYQNIEYFRSAIYIFGVADRDDQPIFGQVTCIVKKKEKWWLVVDLLETVRYDEDLFAWELKTNEDFSLFDPCQLKYYHKGLDYYELNNSTYVSFTTRLTAYH
jgi:hypothetical protein